MVREIPSCLHFAKMEKNYNKLLVVPHLSINMGKIKLNNTLYSGFYDIKIGESMHDKHFITICFIETLARTTT
jgi:hypothetical protein